jgi:hypothetical protein
MNKIFGSLTALAFLTLLASTPAQAVPVSFLVDSGDPFLTGNNTNNDCSGYFGSGFEKCMISYDGVNVSPVIIQFGDEADEINSSLFPSVTGKEWSFDSNENSSLGEWTYTPEGDDPDVRFWVAKAGNGFNLFWDVDQDDLDAGVCKTINSLECLLAANSVTSGLWSTPDGKNLSHITFYDSKPSLVPVPAAFWLFGTALIGFIGISRRTNVA